MEFPRLLYRHGGPWALEAGGFSVLEVADEAAFALAQADGWHLDQYAAKDAAVAAVVAHEDAEQDNAKPTREELEAKAQELGITFSAKVSDRKLGTLIAEALEPKPEA